MDQRFDKMSSDILLTNEAASGLSERVKELRHPEKYDYAASDSQWDENAEYQYSKQRLAAIDRRLRFLGQRLKVLTIVDEKPPDDGRVYFGSWVTIEDEDGDTKTYRIVGPDEIDAAKKWISMDSPVGTSLLSRQLGDEITVRRPKGEVTCEIIEVRNTPPE